MNTAFDSDGKYGADMPRIFLYVLPIIRIVIISIGAGTMKDIPLFGDSNTYGYYCSNQSANIGVDKYLSPVSGSSATMTFPLFSGRFAS